LDCVFGHNHVRSCLRHPVGGHTDEVGLENKVAFAALTADDDGFLGGTFPQQREKAVCAVDEANGVEFKLSVRGTFVKNKRGAGKSKLHDNRTLARVAPHHCA